MKRKQFLRNARIKLGNKTTGRFVSYDNVRIKFKIEKDLEDKENTAEIEVYGLNIDSIANFQVLESDKQLYCILEIGYGGYYEVLFEGEIDNVDVLPKVGPDKIVRFSAADGNFAINKSFAISSFAMNFNYREILKFLLYRMSNDGNISIKNAEAIVNSIGNENTKSSVVISGKTSYHLKRLLSRFGYQYSVQNGELRIIPYNGYDEKLTIAKIDASTGLIGSPTYGDKGKATEYAKFVAKNLQGELHLFNGRIMYFNKRK